MEPDLVTKTKFAELSGVTPGRVSQWLRARKIYGDAIVGARIRVSIARQQLKETLDLNQRLGANGRVRFDDDPTSADPLEAGIKRARLEQLELANEQARAVREARAGRYTETDDARRELGRIAARMVSMFEGALSEFATAIAAKSNLPARDALHILRTTFRTVRERASTAEAARARALSSMVDE